MLFLLSFIPDPTNISLHQISNMEGNITVARSWNELNNWQLSEIAHLYLNTTPENFSEAYKVMIMILFQKTPEKEDQKFLKKLKRNVPISELEKHAKFLKDTTNLTRFPEIPGLIKPADGLGDITARHFSTIDTYFFHWNNDRNDLNLKRLAASLYRIKPQFDDLDIMKVDAITRKMSIKELESIALAYMFNRIYIEELYPIVFPPPQEETEEEKFKPVFKKKPVFTPFDKAIIAMSMDELQPLGKKQDVNNVRIYEFFSVMSESIIYHRNKANAYGTK